MKSSNLVPVIIMSLETQVFHPPIEEQRETLRQIVDDKQLKLGYGCFQGVEEVSWIVVNPSDSQQFRLIGLAWENFQHSILYLDNERNAHLWEISHAGNVRERPLGKFIACTHEAAFQNGAWTYDVVQGQYYMVHV